MRNAKLKLMTVILAFSSIASAQGPTPGLHTEDNEVVCQMNDFLETKIYIDRDTTYDKAIGQLSPKIIEQPTVNARAWNNQLFEVKLVKVSRAREKF